jgi:hypothetical protein
MEGNHSGTGVRIFQDEAKYFQGMDSKLIKRTTSTGTSLGPALVEGF